MENYLADEVEATQCSYCNGRLHEDTVQAAFWGLEGMVAIKDIPARVCERCGEQFYDEETTSTIHRLLNFRPGEEAVCEKIVVPVYSFAATKP